MMGLPNPKCSKCERPYADTDDLQYQHKECVGCMIDRIAELEADLAEANARETSLRQTNITVIGELTRYRERFPALEAERDEGLCDGHRLQSEEFRAGGGKREICFACRIAELEAERDRYRDLAHEWQERCDKAWKEHYDLRELVRAVVENAETIDRGRAAEIDKAVFDALAAEVEKP